MTIENYDATYMEASARNEEIDEWVANGSTESPQEINDLLDSKSWQAFQKIGEKMRKNNAAMDKARLELGLEVYDSWDIERQSADHNPNPGDVCVVLPFDKEAKRDLRFVLVTNIDKEFKMAWVALVSSDLHRAGGTDVILEPIRTGLYSDVMVETDVISPVYYDQLSQPIGNVEQDVLDGVYETQLSGVPKVPHAMRGLPYEGERDPSYLFKFDELRILKGFGGRALKDYLKDI